MSIYAYLTMFLIVTSASQSFANTSGEKSNETPKKANRESPYERPHGYQGDIVGYNKHTEIWDDGTKHFVVNRWPKGIVPYVIDASANFNKKELTVIAQAMLEFQKKTCIKFVPRNKRQSNYIIIKSLPNRGCSSRVGKNRKEGGQEVQLQKGNPGCMTLATVIHELMHVIGFDHEHSRPDRDRFVVIHFENIRPGMAHNFEKLSKSQFDDVGVPYDTNSVMQYAENFFAVDRQHPTMTAKKGGSLGNKNGFTKYDITEINRLYECPEKKKGI